MNNNPPPKPKDLPPRIVNEMDRGDINDLEFNMYIIRIILLCLIFFILGMLFMSKVLIIFKSTYKDGQVDALTGQIKYELVTNQDSTRTWKYIEKDE